MHTIENKQKVLFVCTGNSCRSQIAEGLLKDMANEQFEVFSAGSEPSQVHPNAVSVMKEKNIDISQNTSDHIDKYHSYGIDIIITVCDNANEVCPVFNKNIKRIHWSIDDPFRGWDPNKSDINKFRKTRDELEFHINQFINGEKKG
ncbi:MAG: arsenate reductase ArsC [Candidatus Neomarinimicrobiota bacterium]